jgi:hypothetical protein
MQGPAVHGIAAPSGGPALKIVRLFEILFMLMNSRIKKASTSIFSIPAFHRKQIFADTYFETEKES